MKMQSHLRLSLLSFPLILLACFHPVSHDPPPQVDPASEPVNTIAVWQGFKHSWTYNHRLQRLSDLVQSDPKSGGTTSVHTFHAAATGIGSDVGVYQSYYTMARIQGVHIYSGSEQFRFVGKKGENVQDSRTIRIPLENGISRNLHAVAFLNGFDLYTNLNAFKIQHLELKISDSTIDSAQNEIVFDLAASVTLDCRSLECKKFDPNYNYSLRVEYAVISGGENFASSTLNISNSFHWNKKEELPLSSRQHSITGNGKLEFSNAFIAFKSLNVDLDKEHWFIDWNTFVNPMEYNSESGVYKYRSGLVIREWKEGMRRDSAEPLESMFSFRDRGAGTVSAEVALIQFASGCTEQDSVSGQIDWKGRGREKHPEDAIDRHTILWEKDCTKSD